MVICSCDRTLNNIYSLIRHVQFKHFDPDDDGHFICPFDNCSFKRFSGSTNIKKHYEIHHLNDKGFEFLSPNSTNSSNQLNQTVLVSSLMDLDSEYNYNPNDLINDVPSPYSSQSNQLDLIITHDETPIYKLNLYKSFGIEEKFCDLIVNQKMDFKITESAATKISDQYLDFILDGLDSGELNTQKIRELKKYSKSFYNIKNNVLDRQVNGDVLKEIEAVGIDSKTYTFSYISIITTIKQILADPIAMEYIMKFHTKLPDPNYYTSIKDVENFKFDPESKVIHLYIQFSFDHFGITRNPSTNVSIMYFTILNLEYWLQSSRDCVYECIVCNKDTYKNIGCEALVDPLIEDLEKLESEPIKLSNDYEVKLIFQSLAADNEASNDFMDIEGFRARFCKVCNIHQNQLKFLYSGEFNQPILRKQLPPSHAFNRITERLFNKIYFYSFDPFHDFSSSGIFVKVLSPMIKIYYIDGPNYRRDLNRFSINKTKLMKKYKDLNHRNGTITDIDIDGVPSGTCTQVADFFILFSYLDEIVDRGSNHFKLYLKLRRIYLFIINEKIPKIRIQFLHSEIKDFLHDYFNIYTKYNSKLTVIPKMHHLEHYPKFIKNMANPKFYDTARYERKHQDPKQTEMNSRQFKNKSFSIAKWYALTNKIQFKLIESIKLNKRKIDLDQPINQRFRRFVNLQIEFEDVKEVKIKKVNFKIGKILRLKSDPIRFVKIVLIIKQEDDFIIIGSCLRSIFFESSKCSFKVEFEDCLIRINTDNIYHQECILDEKNMYIIKEFSLDDDI